MSQELSEKTRTTVKKQIPHYDKLSGEEQLVEVLKVIMADFDIFCERNLMIQDKISGDIIPFELNWAQRILVDRVLDDIAHGRPIRYIILKARQLGLSTVIEALCYWWTTTHRNIKAVIIAHETDASSNLYEMFKRFFDNCHPLFQPDRKYNTRKDLVFDLEDNVKEQMISEGKKPNGLGSQIKTLVAKVGKGRSATIHFFHGSEVAFWESNADVISSAVQAVPLAPNTFVFLESTANGVGGYFYDEWQLAMKGESAFKPLFFAWHQHDEYELPAPEGGLDIYDEEETELLAIFRKAGYPKESWDRKICWRRAKKKEFRSDPKKFYQEYPKDDMEAFLASGRPVFDIKMLRKMEELALEHQKKQMFGQIIANPDPTSQHKFIFEQVEKQFQDQDPTPLKVWKLPVKDEKYTIAVDVSEGKIMNAASGKENDYSVIDVMDANWMTVARWRGHIDPDLLGGVAFNIGMFYNGALIGPEVNNHGIATAQALRNKFYRNLYMRETAEDEQFQVRTSKIGWMTNKKTKPVAIEDLVAAIRDGDIIDLDVVFIRECMTYVRDDQGYTDAQEGTFDDCVMAKAINLQMAQWNAYDKEYVKDHVRKPKKRNLDATNSRSDIESIAAGRQRPRTNVDAVRRRREARSRHRIGNRSW